MPKGNMSTAKKGFKVDPPWWPAHWASRRRFARTQQFARGLSGEGFCLIQGRHDQMRVVFRLRKVWGSWAGCPWPHSSWHRLPLVDPSKTREVLSRDTHRTAAATMPGQAKKTLDLRVFHYAV